MQSYLWVLKYVLQTQSAGRYLISLLARCPAADSQSRHARSSCTVSLLCEVGTATDCVLPHFIKYCILGCWLYREMPVWGVYVWCGLFFSPCILSCVRHNGSLTSNCHGIKDRWNCNVSEACFVLEKLAVINIGPLGWSGPHSSSNHSCSLWQSVCASLLPSPSVIPFWISPSHLGCGRVLMARGIGVTHTMIVLVWLKSVPVCGRQWWSGSQAGLPLKPVLRAWLLPGRFLPALCSSFPLKQPSQPQISRLRISVGCRRANERSVLRLCCLDKDAVARACRVP